MMGSDLAPVDSVPAGNLVAIEGLQNYVLKTATLCSTPSCIPLSGMSHQVAPIVRIAVEPQNFEHLDKLKYGLAILAQADPCVECFQEESGEHVIICLGELHMSRCIDALQNKFARIPLKVSPPIVPFRETLAPKRTGNIQQHTVPHNEDNVASESTGKIQLSIRCEPLPPDISTFLESNVTKIEALINAIDDNTCGDLLVTFAIHISSHKLNTLSHLYWSRYRWTLSRIYIGINFMLSKEFGYEKCTGYFGRTLELWA